MVLSAASRSHLVVHVVSGSLYVSHYLPFNVKVACTFFVPAHAFAHTSVPRTRSSHLAPCACSSLPPRPLSAPSLVSSLSWPSVRFPPQSCPLCSLSALPFVRPASCPVRLLSVPCPLYPSTSSSRISYVACAISQPDSHLISFCLSLRSPTPILPRISSMVLVLHPFPSGSSLPVVGFVCSGTMLACRPSRHIMKTKRRKPK